LQRPYEREELEREIVDIIVREAKLDRTQVTPDATLEALQLQSIDLVEVMMALEEKFGVYFPMDSSIVEAKSVEQFVKAVASHISDAGKLSDAGP
jgi:acyl carrier protein